MQLVINTQDKPLADLGSIGEIHSDFQRESLLAQLEKAACASEITKHHSTPDLRKIHVIFSVEEEMAITGLFAGVIGPCWRDNIFETAADWPFMNVLSKALKESSEQPFCLYCPDLIPRNWEVCGYGYRKTCEQAFCLTYDPYG